MGRYENQPSPFLTYPGMSDAVRKMMDIIVAYVPGETDDTLQNQLENSFRASNVMCEPCPPDVWAVSFQEARETAALFAHQIQQIRILPGVE